MVAGIPGAGIGGLFYLLSAFSLPIRLARRWFRGERRGLRARQVWLQVAMAVGVVGGIWATGWLLGLIVLHGSLAQGASSAGVLRGVPGASANVIRTAALLGGFFTLALVLGAAEAARLLFARGRDRGVLRRLPPPQAL
jgi:hypothetical protein